MEQEPRQEALWPLFCRNLEQMAQWSLLALQSVQSKNLLYKYAEFMYLEIQWLLQ